MKKIFFLLFPLLFISCKEIASSDELLFFEAAQPIDDSELQSIPVKFLGLYKQNDSAYLSIFRKHIVQKTICYINVDKDSLSEIADEIDLKNNIIVLKESKEKHNIKKIDDIFSIEFTSIDTIFSFSQRQKAKRINGTLILSTQDSIFWSIKILNIEDNRLKIRTLNNPNDFKAIDSIVKIKSKVIDSTEILLLPTRKEFAKMLRIKKLGNDAYYMQN